MENIIHPLLNSKRQFIQTSYLESQQRYSEYGTFAADFFEQFNLRWENNWNYFQFLKSKDQPEDFMAIFDNENAIFGIQIDPYCEVICLWNHTIREEIGVWCLGDNPVEIALQRITTDYL